MADKLIGRALGKYEIRELVGHGGMASVYKGYQPDVDRYVAIKVLPPHPGRNPQFVERFRQEARTIARLQHPHILPLYDYGDQDDVLYLVMALIEGGSLARRIRQGPMPLPQVEFNLRQITSALDYAHRQGIIHRDIKPDNILLDREGNALLADFGIAKLLEGGANLTATGGLVGTPAYISPEQAQGLPVDRRSDIYSLGIVVFEMISGKQPYIAETPVQLVLKHINAPVPALSKVVARVPPSLEQVMIRALAKEPADRYQTASSFMEEFSMALRAPGDRDSSTKVDLQQPERYRTVGGERMPTMPIDMSPGTQAGAATPTPSSVPAHTPTPYPPYNTTPPPTGVPYPTMTVQPQNTLLLLGGFAIIALMTVAIVAILVMNNAERNTPTPSSPTTESSTAAPATGVPPTAVAAVPAVQRVGSVSFSTSEAVGDTVNVQVEGLPRPPNGQVYVAWLQNTQDDTLLPLGELRIDGLGSAVLLLTDAEGATLPTLYNALIITREAAGEAYPTPSGAVLYSGGVPVEVPGTLAEILLESPEGLTSASASSGGDYGYGSPEAAGTSLLDGALTEARIAAQHAGLASRASTIGGAKPHAEHTINILRGTNDDLNGDGRGENPGRGIGVVFFLDQIETHLGEAANAPSASAALQGQIELIRVCITNARTWVDEVIALELRLLEAAELAAVENERGESTRLTTAILDGQDLNENGQIEPFEGECGLQQIATFGVSVGNFDLRAGALDE